MKNESGEVIVGLLIGLAVGAAMLWVGSGQQAQTLANATGREVSQWEVIKEEPGKSTLTVIGPAAAGAGIGWALDEFAGSDDGGSSQNNTVQISGNEGPVTVSISGNQANTSSTRTDTRNEGSNNQ